MPNPATAPRDELNEFTRSVWLLGNSNWGNHGVRLRNGLIVKPIYKPAEDETSEDAFFTEDYEYCWNLDGTSVTRRDFDMMEIV
jgi:hypothetical protein